MNPKEIIGDIHISDCPTSELPVKDSLDLARSVFRKGRHESLGGYTVYTQGHNTPGYENQSRVDGYYPGCSTEDKMASDLGVDNQE